MNGILLIDKPRGFTSHDVVAKVRSVIRKASSNQSLVSSQQKLATNDKRLVTPSPKVKVGHTGTLDPFATGLLILVVGSYTKKAAEYSKLDKTYEAELTLGKTSSTGDIEGEIRQESDKKPDNKAVEAVLASFLGQIEQTPHPYSAVKVCGQRAYKAAREGKTVKIEPRKVTIHSFSDVKYTYPKLGFTTSVSSGTYIRSLAEDIGEKLGTGAYLSKLRRTEVGKFNSLGVISLDKLDFGLIQQHLQNRGETASIGA